MKNANQDDTIAAISTPVGESGIGIVRLSGRRALGIADEIFASKGERRASRFDTYTVRYGWVLDEDHKKIDEVVLTVMRAPKSYTREDIVEINCHGGVVSLKKVLELVVRKGARIAEPGEFTKRAFLNGRIDLAQAEAVLDIVKAKTDSSLRAALEHLEGRLSKEVDRIREDIMEILVHVEAGIDFPEEEIEIVKDEGLVRRIDGVIGSLKRLADTAEEGIILREGIFVVICGKPNVGKSSLMNILLKKERVIVTPHPGTTRDAVEEMINLKGIPIRLVDTAGISGTVDRVEREGVVKSKEYIRKADLAFFMLDGSTSIDERDLEIAGLLRGMAKRTLAIINKSDLPQRVTEAEAMAVSNCDGVVRISALLKTGIEALEEKLLGMVWSGKADRAESSIVTNARHKAAIEKARQSALAARVSLERGAPLELASVDLKEAAYQLGLILGKSVSEDVLERIFENFCIGK